MRWTGAVVVTRRDASGCPLFLLVLLARPLAQPAVQADPQCSAHRVKTTYNYRLQ